MPEARSRRPEETAERRLKAGAWRLDLQARGHNSEAVGNTWRPEARLIRTPEAGLGGRGPEAEGQRPDLKAGGWNSEARG